MDRARRHTLAISRTILTILLLLITFCGAPASAYAADEPQSSQTTTDTSTTIAPDETIQVSPAEVPLYNTNVSNDSNSYLELMLGIFAVIMAIGLAAMFGVLKFKQDQQNKLFRQLKQQQNLSQDVTQGDDDLSKLLHQDVMDILRRR
jgi:uncharacterized membrane protein YeiB